MKTTCIYGFFTPIVSNMHIHSDCTLYLVSLKHGVKEKKH